MAAVKKLTPTMIALLKIIAESEGRDEPFKATRTFVALESHGLIKRGLYYRAGRYCYNELTPAGREILATLNAADAN